MEIIGKPEDFDTSDEAIGDRTTGPYATGSKKLYRNPDDMILGGVCGGLSPFLNIDLV